MVLEDFDRRSGGVHRDRARTHASHGIHHEGNRSDVVEVRMGDEDMVDLAEFGQRKVADPGACVDQQVVVDQERGGPQMAPADASRAAQYAQAHRDASYFSSKAVMPSQPRGGGVRRNRAILPAYTSYSLRPGSVLRKATRPS